MINVNTKSWHYKVASFGTSLGQYVPNNLCPYFWRVFKGASIYTLTLLIMVIVCSCAAFAFFLQEVIWLGFMERDLFLSFISLVAKTFVAVHLVNLYRYTSHYKSARKFTFNLPKKKFKEKKPKQKSLFRLWLEAKHDKVCPKLTFEEKS